MKDPDSDPALDDPFTAHLLAGEEALAAGRAPQGLGDDAPELRDRLEGALACVQLLQQLRRPSDPVADAPTRNLREEPGALPDGPGEIPCPVQLGRFQIRRLLGRGGFGIVYLAYDPTLARDVALKVPRAEALADVECRARFQREARAAAALDHPHLVPVHEAGQLGPVCYLALAYCPGPNLAEWLNERTSPVPCGPAARLVLLLAQAVQYAHAHGILHRDLKPSNVLLSPASPPELASAGDAVGPRGGLWQPAPGTAFVPRVTDFGLARFPAGQSAQTQTGTCFGTPGYMAPEQTEGRTGQVGPATDVYALGAILYELLTARPPCWGETALEALWQVKMADPVPPGRLRPQVPRDLETICLKCLQKDPRQRYATAEDLAEDLRRFLSGRAILARPTGAAAQAWKWARRRPALATALAALVLVTALGLAGILRQAQLTRAALADEAAARCEAVLRQQQAQAAQQAEAQERDKSEIALYHHRVALAHREWSAGNSARAARLLDDCRDDLRDWEWRYVRRLCESALLTLEGHVSHPCCVAFSPDGRLLASAAGNWGTREPGEVRLWDSATGRPLWSVRQRGPVMQVAFSPDGAQLAAAGTTWGGSGGEITIWDTATGRPLRSLPGVGAGAFGAAYSPDGRWLATAGVNREVRLWHAATGKAARCLRGHTDNVFSIAFSPDGRLLASASRDGTARVWDIAAGKLRHLLSGPADLRCVAFSPDGTRLVTASYDQSVKVWDVTSGQLLHPYWRHGGAALSAAFAPDGRWVASADTTGQIHVWEAHSGRLVRTVFGHTGSVASVAFSPDGRRLASAGVDRTVRVWDITREQEANPLPDADGAQNVVFSKDGKYLAAAGYTKYSGAVLEKRVRLWSVHDSYRLRLLEGHGHWVTCVAFDPAGRLLASGSQDKTVRIWDVATGKTLHRLAGHQQVVRGVGFSPDGTRLASAGLDRTVRLWDVATGQPLAPVLTHPHPVHDVAFSPDGRRLVSCGAGGMVLAWDAQARTRLFALPGHTRAVERVLFSPDGRRLASAGCDRAIRLWDMTAEPAAGQVAGPVHLLSGQMDTERVTGLAFTPNSRRLASSGRDQTIRLWDVASGHEALTLRGQPQVLGMAFSPDGRQLCSASIHHIKIWDAGAPTPSTGLTPGEAVLWHQQQADECLNAQPPRWFAAAFHGRCLLAAQAADWGLRWGAPPAPADAAPPETSAPSAK